MAKKEQQIQIIADDNGNKIRVSANNPEYAHVRLVQEKIWIAPSGWVRKRNMSTLLHGKLEDLRDLGINKMKYLPGQIVIKEQCEPFDQSNPDRDVKYAGDTGVICCRDGEIIYRRTMYDANCIDTDVLVAHTNGDAIREANSLAASTGIPSTDDVLLDDKASMVSGEEFFKSNEEETDPAQIDLEDSIAEVEEEENHNEEDGETTETKAVEAADSLEENEDSEIEIEEEVEEEIEEEPTSFDL